MSERELLDPDELMHLALDASARADAGAAIQYLRRLLQLQPGHAQALYLLGAQHAQVGMYERAALDMAQALELQPELVPARFQLGWLRLLADDLAAADATWRPLDALGEEDPYFLFKSALLCRARGELDQCQALLARGIALNRINAPLGAEMQRQLDGLHGMAAPGATDAAGPASEADPAGEVPAMFLDAYTRKSH